MKQSNPTGVVTNALRNATLSGLMTLTTASQGSRATQQPWALLLNRFAVEFFQALSAGNKTTSRAKALNAKNSMPKYVAFLRAINVGGHTVKMDYLRSLFEALGFTNVETFIASGNVIFDSPSRTTKALEKKIEACLQQTLGYAVATFIRSTSELADIASYKPFPDAELSAAENSLYVGFMAASPSKAAQQKLLALGLKMNDFHLHGREVYWLLRTKFSDSEFSGARLEKTLGLPATLRNSTTVEKLAAKYP